MKRAPMTSAQRHLRDAPGAPENTRLTACSTCRAVYLDYPDGRTAHGVVFGHDPQPATTERETETTQP